MYQCNGILNVGDEALIYHGRGRWGALGLFPDRTEGSVWSAPVLLPAGQPEILLNAEHADQMRLEIADRNFNLLLDYSDAQSGRVADVGGLDCPVEWP